MPIPESVPKHLQPTWPWPGVWLGVSQDLEQLIQDVIEQIKTDWETFKGLTPNVYITNVMVINDPVIDLQQDLSIVTLAVDYHD